MFSQLFNSEALTGVDARIRYPKEREAIQQIQNGFSFEGANAINWAYEKGLLKQSGDIVLAEVSPTLRCPEACPGCPDSSLLLAELVKRGVVPRFENKATTDVMMKQIQLLHELGVRHFMFIGGTIDSIQTLPDLVEYTQSRDPSINVSWFTDMIPQTDDKDGQPSALLKKNIEHGWIKKVATHVSVDYASTASPILRDTDVVPPKQARVEIYKNDPEYSRKFKSRYGLVGATNLIKGGVKRVVVNTTISHNNADQILPIYEQVSALDEFAREISSPTEVLWTFSPFIWRPHQARGDDPSESPSESWIQAGDLTIINHALQTILDDTYSRNTAGGRRILANSSGYTSLHASTDSYLQHIVLEQDLPFQEGRPEMLQVRPDGTVWLDPMFPRT